MSEFHFQEMFELGEDHTEYRKLSDQHVSVVDFDGESVLRVAPEALSLLAAQAFRDVSHLYRTSHLE